MTGSDGEDCRRERYTITARRWERGWELFHAEVNRFDLAGYPTARSSRISPERVDAAACAAGPPPDATTSGRLRLHTSTPTAVQFVAGQADVSSVPA